MENKKKVCGNNIWVQFLFFSVLLVPFAPDRQPNFKDKHPIRTPSFDTATFKPGSEYSSSFCYVFGY